MTIQGDVSNYSMNPKEFIGTFVPQNSPTLHLVLLVREIRYRPRVPMNGERKPFAGRL